MLASRIAAMLDYALEKQEGTYVTTVPYSTDVDGRVVLGTQAWREFHLDSGLEVGQAIFVTLRNTNRRNLEMMIVVDSVI